MRAMVRELIFSNGIIEGEYKRFIVEMFPSLEANFRQRKQYDEYHYDSTDIELTLDQIEKLTNMFCTQINRTELEIFL